MFFCGKPFDSSNVLNTGGAKFVISLLGSILLKLFSQALFRKGSRGLPTTRNLKPLLRSPVQLAQQLNFTIPTEP